VAALLRLIAAVVIGVAASETVHACPVCFQVEDGAVAEGVRDAVLVLVGVTVSVLTGVGLWWRRLVRNQERS
jgi:hypothetical protein